MENLGTLKGRYAKLATTRDIYLDRARECSKLTIPHLIPPSGHTASTRLPTPWQATGARGVNNLASKLNLTLLPINQPFFKMALDDFAMEKLAQRRGARGEIEKALSKYERAVMAEVDATAIRTASFEAMKHWLVGGNVGLFMPPEGGMKMYMLAQYVVKRDPMGNLLEAIVEENISPMELPEGVRAAALAAKINADGKVANDSEDSVQLFTGINRTPTGWRVWQEANDVPIPGTEGTYPLDALPWMFLRGTSIAGEDYGRSYVEEYLGDIKTLEGLTKAVSQGAAAAAKLLLMVNPNGTTRVEDVTEKESGEAVEGNAADVTILHMDKDRDFRVALELMRDLKQNLAFAFLLNTAIQRPGERVTAEEIRYMAQELESALGGIYSSMAQEYQLPLVRRVIQRMEKSGRLPFMPKGLIRPTITTGLDAIGRGNDLNKLDQFVAGTAQVFGPEIVLRTVSPEEYMNRRGAALGIDTDGLVLTAEEQAQRDQAAAQQQMAQQVAPNVVNKAGDIMRDQLNQQ